MDMHMPGGNPVLFTDPDGREYLVCDPDGKNCAKVSDEDFYAERRALEKTGNEYTGSRDFFESGQIKNADGGVVTYVQISIDDPVDKLSSQFGERLPLFRKQLSSSLG